MIEKNVKVYLSSKIYKNIIYYLADIKSLLEKNACMKK